MQDTFVGPIPELYLRYIDDVFGVTNMSALDLDNWITAMQALHPSIQFTYVISTEKVSFLDIDFGCTEGIIESSVYYKETDTHAYLRYDSFHSKSTKDAIPYSQFLRLRRLISSDAIFDNKCKEMTSFFEQRGYPTQLLEQAKNRIKNVSREIALAPRDLSPSPYHIPFVTKYHPQVYKVFRSIQKSWHILTDDPGLSSLFENKPLLSLKRGQNLKDMLVKSDVSSQSELGGTFPCNRPRCKTCERVVSCSTVHGPNGSFIIHHSYTCTSSNLVYCIICSRCGDLYIGETKRKLAERLREHLQDIRKNNRTSPVAQHFSRQGHSIEDVSVCVLTTCGSENIRKTKEMELINRLGTLDPLGMNLDFSFI